MTEIIGVRLQNAGKTYYFSPQGKKAKVGDSVICKTAHGLECGKVSIANKEVDDDDIIKPLQPIIRIATPKDIEICNENSKIEKEAYPVCTQFIRKHNLDMKLVSVNYTFDRSKMLFFFTSDGRVDFRALVKDLASKFHTRIELRQIGVRDEAKMLGGIGICGKSFCCSDFLDGFHPVSIKMAKMQNLSLNPVKISGCCGRLMCCLKYEQNAYEDIYKVAPKNGSFVQTPEGNGKVIDGNPLRGVYRVVLESNPGAAPKEFNIDDLKIIKSRKK